MERGRLPRPPLSPVRPREVVHGRQRVRVLVPQDAPPLLQHLLVERGRLPRPPLSPVRPREVVHGRQRVRVLVPQDAPPLLQHLLVERGRLPRPPLSPVRLREVVHGRQRVRVLVPQDERLSSFALDEETGEAVLGTYGGLVSAMSANTESSNVCLREPQTPVTRFTSQVMSISLSTTNLTKMLVCCSLGNENNSGTIHVGKSTYADDAHQGLEVYAVMRPRERELVYF